MSAFDAYTADQIETAVRSAMDARDMPAAASLLHVLALKAPNRAQLWLDAIQLANGEPS